MSAREKVLPLAELEKVAETARRDSKRVVLCHGVFDLVHPGHVLHLKEARRHGDLLMVTLTPDEFVRKGPGRPVFNQRLRLETIAALECVDYVALNEWPTAVETIRRLKPHVYVKGSDYAQPESDLTGKIVEEEAAVRSVGGRVVFTDEESFSSSSLINEHFSRLPAGTDAYLRDFRRRYSRGEVLRALENLADVSVLVIGEAIVDQYCYCTPLGKAAKETIIATRYISEEKFAGGSLAVANHLAGFCRRVTLVTCLGEGDSETDFIRKSLRPNVRLLAARTPERGTIVKRRYVDPTFLAKMFEVQHLEDRPLPAQIEEEVRSVVESHLADHDMLLVADFGHGLLTDGLRQSVCSSDRFLAVNTQINSANFGFNVVTKYARADYICLHEGEVRLAAGVQYGDMRVMAEGLRSRLKASHLMVTRGPRGSVLVRNNGSTSETPAFSVRVVDRTGAGDAFFSVTAPCVYRGFSPEVVGFVGNCVGALAVETVGNREAVDLRTLQKFISHLLM